MWVTARDCGDQLGLAGREALARVEAPDAFQQPLAAQHLVAAGDRSMIRSLLTGCQAFRTDRRGVAAMEYGLIAAFVAVAIIAGVTSLGSNLGGFFTTMAGHFAAGGG